MSEIVPESPCISVCVLDKQEICRGCFRSAVEISDWFMASPQQKRDILERAQQRREASTRTKQR
ncbi:MAG: DUF1289 domain-containing protein [Pseudomonadales bacterium]|nr:DUF1289 domain-containing protein [Halioglobus sp.]MCP5130661.1 DUF1289 domain-containing protein [Pseudomonadales bacterium]